MKVSGEIIIGTGAHTYEGVANFVRLSDDGWLVQWRSWDPWNNYDIFRKNGGDYVEIFNADGSVRVKPTLLSKPEELSLVFSMDNDLSDFGMRKIAATADGGWLEIWIPPKVGTDPQLLKMQKFSGIGAKIGLETVVSSDINLSWESQDRPAVAMLANGGWVVTWLGAGGKTAYQQAYRADGSANGDQVVLESGTAYKISNIVVSSSSDGSFETHWTTKATQKSLSEQHVQTFGTDGTENGPSKTLGECVEKDFLLKDGGHVRIQLDLEREAYLLEVLNSDGSLRKAPIVVGVGGESGSFQVTELSGGKFVVTSVEVDGHGKPSLREQLFTANGDKIGAAVNFGTGLSYEVEQSVALDNGGWVTVWAKNSKTVDGKDIFQQVFNADGSKNGGETRVNDTTAGEQRSYNVIAVGTGWIVSWTSFNQGWGNAVAVQKIFGVDGVSDLVYGTAKADNLDGDNGSDSIDGRSGDDIVNGKGGNDALLGSGGNDTLSGGTGADTLSGGDGNDKMNGGKGGDVMVGGAGNDTYYIDSAVDRVLESALAGTDKLISTISVTLADNIENGSLSGASSINATGNNANNIITGNIGSNTLSGGSGADTLDGGAGSDILNGGAGSDALTGGAGKDIFLFNTPAKVGSIDTISDYSVADDTINLAKTAFTAFLKTGILTSAAFTANDKGMALDANDRIIYETDTGKLFYDSNGSAAGGLIQIAQLSAHLKMTYAEFVIV